MKIDEHKTDIAIFAEIGERIRHARIRERLQQSELADLCGISRFSVIKLEHGEGGTRLSTLIAVMRQLRMLHLLDVAFPEVSLSPLELSELEAKRKHFPEVVRKRRRETVPKPGIKLWGWGSGS